MVHSPGISLSSVGVTAGGISEADERRVNQTRRNHFEAEAQSPGGSKNNGGRSFQKEVFLVVDTRKCIRLRNP